MEDALAKGVTLPLKFQATPTVTAGGGVSLSSGAFRYCPLAWDTVLTSWSILPLFSLENLS